MAPKGQFEEPQNVPDGTRAHYWSFQRVLWTAGTILQKAIIRLQDRFSLYSYTRWINDVERAAFRRVLSGKQDDASDRLNVCFVVSGANADQRSLSRTYESIRQQVNCKWRIVLLQSQSSATNMNREFKSWISSCSDIQVILLEEAGAPLAWMSIADRFTEEWVVPVMPGDQFGVHWSQLVKKYIQPDVDILYWDEDEISTNGRRTHPDFKPGWSPELLFSMNYLEQAAFRRSLICDVMDQKAKSEASESWVLYVAQQARTVSHIPYILSHRSAGYRRSERSVRHAVGVQAYLTHNGFSGSRVDVNEKQMLRVSWELDYPIVSIIIPTKNNLFFLQRCLASLFEKTDYPAYEIILMDDHSTDPEVLAYYDDLLAAHPEVKLHKNTEKFNYSRVNNQGAARAKGTLLLFLNNDVEILESGWLKEMVRWALLPGVGMVGAKLLYPDGTIQHAGIVLGMTGHAGHVYAGKPSPENPLFVSPEVYRNVSAVTGACMLVRADLFRRLDGFDERLGLVFNDVELGVRVVNSGYRVVYTPAAVLTHYEGRSRAHYIPSEDIRLGAQRLEGQIGEGDMYYSPNLSLAVNWPSYRRPFETAAPTLLNQIVRFKG